MNLVISFVNHSIAGAVFSIENEQLHIHAIKKHHLSYDIFRGDYRLSNTITMLIDSLEKVSGNCRLNSAEVLVGFPDIEVLENWIDISEDQEWGITFKRDECITRLNSQSKAMQMLAGMEILLNGTEPAFFRNHTIFELGGIIGVGEDELSAMRLDIYWAEKPVRHIIDRVNGCGVNVENMHAGFLFADMPFLQFAKNQNAKWVLYLRLYGTDLFSMLKYEDFTLFLGFYNISNQQVIISDIANIVNKFINKEEMLYITTLSTLPKNSEFLRKLFEGLPRSKWFEPQWDDWVKEEMRDTDYIEILGYMECYRKWSSIE
jgi:hypothetical protein